MAFLKFIFILILNFFFINADLCAQNNVSNIRLHLSEDKERIVIDSDNKVNFKAFVLKQPNRLVLDLENTSSIILAPNFKADKLVDVVRSGKYSNNNTRIVFDLNAESKIISNFYLAPNSDNKNHRIVIDLSFDFNNTNSEDLIGKLIEKNNLYDGEKDVLNEIIDNILFKNETESKDNIKKGNKNNLVASNKNNSPNYNISKEKRKPRIIIDAGHGGKDPGTIGLRGTKEKIITLTYAKSLKEALEKTNKYKVYLTRNSDFFVELRDRISIARRFKGDLFISIHADSALNTSARGFSIYTLSQTASDTRTAQLAQKENKADIIGGLDLYGEYQDTINTLVDISRRKAMNDSKKFARLLEKELHKRNVSGLGQMRKYANFAVLTSADMPSILLELGFLSNRTDERMIRSFGYKTKIMNSLIYSVDEYFKNI